ncbi:hypothetical protein CDD82_3505 [Ophiocordyceps australis]|uniref:Uncharacterized protein n=1 Tax=Ophiocordyceps australis TaxID=1399860 RepID=A0A2C5ZCG4_9HYPO|nr:hypothetical protein CDD82_3505 [Ophiocordyceps australis]
MAPVAARYEPLVRAPRALRKPAPPLPTSARMVSSVTAAMVEPHAVIDEAYWSANLRSPVLFNQALQTLLASPDFAHVDVLVEIGPHSALAGPIKQIKAAVHADRIDYLPTLLRNSDSAVQLLNLAGHMFLRGYPLDMDRVAHAYADQTPVRGKPVRGATIVDLPPYQWNYTRPYWAESRTSREHRHPRFPRHDVLGQLTLGGSLAEPTWRNVLRVRDLPWLRHHHLGGESVFPAAGYFAMAIEAVRQLNELTTHPLAVESFVLRDLSIKTALVTPDDDDGIEVLLSMRPSPHANAWWDWSVSSVDADRLSKDHMSGSIAINARPRGKPPRPVPDFPQRASGKAWNDALRQVGFDYGPTFQDMDNVRFDGKSYQAAATTNIKHVVDHALGESRYVLHPASIDSALQLCIAAIYAGRTNAMDCGVVPVQVDEVAIWPPTDSQLQAAKANIYATVHSRGIRTSESNLQMTAADGEMVMEIVNMRATTYEAAVPQKPDSALDDAPYGTMAWRPDFDTLANRHALSVPHLVDMALFKYPAFKTAELGTKHAADILANNPHASYTAVVGSHHDAELAKLAIAGFHNAKVVQVDANEELSAQGLNHHSFDIVIAQGPDALASKMASLAKPNSSPVSSGVSIFNAVEAKPTPNEHSVQLVYRATQASIVASVKTALEALGWHVTVSSLEQCIHHNIAPHVIMLADFESCLLFTVSPGEFAAIKTIIAETSSLLWVTTSALLHGKKPEQAMVSGLARSLTAEQASLDFRVLDIDVDSVDTDLMVASISKVAQLQATKAEEVPEREFCLSNGKTYISRLARNDQLNSLYTCADKPEPNMFTPGDCISGRVLKGKVVFQEQQRIETIQPGHVEVQVHVSGLTKEGVLVVSGSDYSTKFSHEIGGLVTRVGPGVESLAVGDRVAGFSLGCFDSYQQVPAAMLFKLKPDDDMNLITRSIVSYATTLYGMQTLGRTKKGDVVLVLNKSGFSGAAAIKFSRLVGAVPYAVAKTDDEAHYLESQLGLDPKCIIRASDGLVSERLAQLTNGHGADLVFSAGSVDAGDAREAWRCIAPFGRFIDSGRKDILGRHILDGLPVKRGASYIPFDILHVCESHPEQLTALLPTIVDHVRKGSSACLGAIHPLHLADLDQAISTFSDAFGAAKSFVEYRASDKPIQVLPARSKLQFRSDATYLLVGGLGGLGRSLTSWMMESGARRFVFLSRSAADAPSAAKLVKDLESAGATVDVVRGDATSLQDVERAVSQVPSEHPIKGVVHAAMVLRDGLFHSMTYESWKQSTQPKVLGAQNLDRVLSKQQLDFFIMTSSVSGILGTPGQSSYAAANAYLDSLARHRHSKGNVATSAVLPMVLGVGVVAENSQLEEALKRKGVYGVDEEDLLQSFEASVVSQKLHSVPDHVVVGLDPAKLQRVVNDETATDIFWLQDSRFSHAVHAINSSADDPTSSGGQSILATIKAAASLAEAVTAVNEHFVDKLARMLMLDPEDVNPEAGSIASYGIDSMIGAELRNWIFKEYRMDVPFQQLLGPTLTIAKFASQVCAANGKEE